MNLAAATCIGRRDHCSQIEDRVVAGSAHLDRVSRLAGLLLLLLLLGDLHLELALRQDMLHELLVATSLHASWRLIPVLR